jgi:signal transduction histidine kinase
MQRMRPDVLDSMGLVEAVKELVEEWRDRRPNLAWEFRTSGVLDHFPNGIEISAYRIIQESVTNVIKHAEASSVTLSLSELVHDGGRYIEVTVIDDGRGIDPGKNSRGIGLTGMRERALSANGEFEVRSPAGGGTLVRTVLPLEVSQ